VYPFVEVKGECVATVHRVEFPQGTLNLLIQGLRRGIETRWGTSENNRRAKNYELARSGRRQLATAKAQVLGTA
jgi:hypothetical protein